MLEAMKLSAIGQSKGPRISAARSRAAFTLVELVVVMAIMVVVIGIVAPAFKGFLQGRNLTNEAQQFLSSTRYAMGRAVGEGVPVGLWMDVKQGKYGLAASGGYTETQTNALEFKLDPDVQITASRASGPLTQSNSWTVVSTRRSWMPVIRFQPDGFISDDSPTRIVFKQGPTQITIGENASHTRYEVQSNQRKSARF
jgi:type II secretion system protein H